jgi:hypothetical protein
MKKQILNHNFLSNNTYKIKKNIKHCLQVGYCFKIRYKNKISHFNSIIIKSTFFYNYNPMKSP